jgi:hypothetical protein
MEAKTILRLIKNDIAHLEEITGAFALDSLPASDEVEISIVRAKTLLRELELLLKLTVELEDVQKKTILTESSLVFHSEHEPFELFDSEIDDAEPNVEAIPEEEDFAPSEEPPVAEFDINDQPDIEATSDILIDTLPAEEPVAELVGNEEPVATIVENEEPDSIELNIQNLEYEDVEDQLSTHDEPDISDGIVQDKLVDIEIEYVTDEAAIPVDEEPASEEIIIIPENTEDKEETSAEAPQDQKKTLNETLGESQQLVNDILSTEKSDHGYQIIPINSIWDGIGINDRFLFIRELFANSSAKFETTIYALDKLDTIQEAVTYLKMNFKWNKTEASQKFLVLVKRRFTK